MPAKTKPLNTSEYSYHQWRLIVKGKQLSETYPSNCFPNEVIKKMYLQHARKNSENEIRYLLRHFLLPTAGLFGDRYTFRHLQSLPNKERQNIIDKSEFLKRLQNYKTPWEGTTWTMDLLPADPNGAIEIINKYIDVHYRFLPDIILTGLRDSQDIIRAKYRDLKEPSESLCQPKSPHFSGEIIDYYKKAGYEIADLININIAGDVIFKANKFGPGEKETILIQCNTWTKNVGIDLLERFFSKINDQTANKGIVFTISKFSPKALGYEKKKHQIDLVDGTNLANFLNGRF